MSDLHGCYYEFEDALDLVEEHLGEKDTMLCLLGDYIHGGDGSYEVLDRIMSLQKRYGKDKIIALMGNHEDLVLTGFSSINSENDEPREDDDKYINWISNLPTHFTYGNTIFVHAGIDEEAGEDWEWGTSDETFTSKYPADLGKVEGLDKKIVAGHIGTYSISNDPNFNDIYYDGQSHFYIDGTVIKTGVIPVLLVDTDKDKYYKVTDFDIEEVLAYK